MNTTKKLAQGGLLTALALILCYAEAQLPGFFPIPGLKLGLGNLAVLLALSRSGSAQAWSVNLVRIVLAAALFGTGVSLTFSLAGGFFSTLVMVVLRRRNLHIISVSAAGGIAHNIGQILAAMALMQTASLGWYLLLLWFSGLVCGGVLGILGGILCARLPARKGGTA